MEVVALSLIGVIMVVGGHGLIMAIEEGFSDVAKAISELKKDK